jgi:predicted RNase H-like HicB family nuclease
VSTVAKIRVEYLWDDDAKAWGFEVPALHIVGGGPSREDARRRAREAIAFALEEQDEPEDGTEAEYLDIALADGCLSD